jgi:hypothetical protein
MSYPCDFWGKIDCRTIKGLTIKRNRSRYLYGGKFVTTATGHNHGRKNRDE